MEKIALGIIDVQSGFMPAAEGERLGVAGFGELPVTDGEQIVSPVNQLIAAFAVSKDAAIFTTQDWHPAVTAHFSETPDFATNWPVHCVAGTPGAELHPDIVVPATATRIVKGFEALKNGADDTSYSGYFGVTEGILTLPEWLGDRGISKVVLGGLALDYCVGKTALDIRNRMGIAVQVAFDATRSISDESEAAMLHDFQNAGVEIIDSRSVIEELAKA